MSSTTNPRAGQYLKGLMKKAQEVIKLVIGNSEVYAEEDTGGDLKFDPEIMMKIEVSFDKHFLPKEKVVKLNVRGSQFFHDIRRNIREINGIYIVYPQEYQYQLDVRREEWEKRLISELNQGYRLSLKTILFFSEEEIARKYQRKGISGIRRPYNLKKGELLIIAGPFANFNTNASPLCTVKVDLAQNQPGKKGTYKKTKKSFKTKYYGKFSPAAGAYLYVGGEWYHNLFIPQLYDPEEPLFFSFRIADNGRNLKFFSDLNRRGIDIRAHLKTKSEPLSEHLIYTINPEYLQGFEIADFKLTISYSFNGIKTQKTSPIEATPQKAKKPKNTLDENLQPGESISPQESLPDQEALPYLENDTILLPIPKEGDIPSYMMTIGNEKKNVKFYASSIDKEISILTSAEGEKIYHRNISDTFEYSININSQHYTISNLFLSQIDHALLKIYFGWELRTDIKEKFYLNADSFIFGRNPLGNLNYSLKKESPVQLIRLNKGTEEFWRIGTSRDHGLLIGKKVNNFYTHSIYNISLNFPIYVLDGENFKKGSIRPMILEPVSGTENQKKCTTFLNHLKNMLLNQPAKPENLSSLFVPLKEFANNKVLKNNDLVIIGNRIFRYVVPVIMETPLSNRIQEGIQKKVLIGQSILR